MDARTVAGRELRNNERARFFSRVDVAGPPHPYDPGAAACWLWVGRIGDGGYGRFDLSDGSSDRAHRVSYRLAHGSAPGLLRHTCDRRACVNPSHLLPGTIADNNRDRSLRGRTSRRFGADNPCTKLTPADIAHICENPRGLLQRELAEIHGITQSHVSRIQRTSRGKGLHGSPSAAETR